MRTINIKFNELCEEIDYWKEQALYWKEKYEEIDKKYHELLNESIKHNGAMMGNFLKFALNSNEEIIKKSFKEDIK